MTRLRRWFLAYFHISPRWVCELSKGPRDYHDYMDSTTPEPWHMHLHQCARCNKRFYI